MSPTTHDIIVRDNSRLRARNRTFRRVMRELLDAGEGTDIRRWERAKQAAADVLGDDQLVDLHSLRRHQREMAALDRISMAALDHFTTPRGDGAA